MTYQSAPLQELGPGKSKEVDLTYLVCDYVQGVRQWIPTRQLTFGSIEYLESLCINDLALTSPTISRKLGSN